MPDRQRIGFDRTIAAEWLDAAVARVMTEEPPDATRKFLWEFLEGVEPGTTNNSSRGKTLTVLTRIWVSVPEQAEPLKRAALKSILSSPAEQRFGIHWAMVAGTHPFFFDVATHIGKLLKLSGQANRSQIWRRMVDTWGDRLTLERTIQHVIKSITQWGLLRPGREKGSLVGPAERISVNEEVAQLLAHSVLLGHNKGLPLSQLLDHASLFAFALPPTVRELTRNPNIRIQRQGDQSDFVELA